MYSTPNAKGGLRERVWVPGVACLFALLACGDSSRPVTAVSLADRTMRLEVRPESATVAGFDSHQFTAYAIDAKGGATRVEVTWTAESGRIDDVGTYFAETSEGVYEVTAATAHGLHAVATAHVTSPEVAYVESATAAAVMFVGDTLPFLAVPRAKNGAALDQTVEWEAWPESVVTASADGLVRARGEGVGLLSARSGDATALFPLTVRSLTAFSVDVNPAAAAIVVGASLQLEAIPLADQGDTVSIATSWSSSDSAVARVSSTGLVTGISEGVSTITASTGDASGSAFIAINTIPVASVDVDPSQAALVVGDEIQLNAIARAADGSRLARPIIWTSSDSSVATVTASGMVAGMGPGTAEVFAGTGVQTGSAYVSVTGPTVSTIELAPTAFELEVGESRRIEASPQTAEGTVIGVPIAWSSSDLAVASVSGGLVTAIGEGRATITASAGAASAVATVDATISGPTSVQLSPGSVSLQVGDSRQVTATALDSNGFALDRVFEWSSSDSGVARVSSTGLVSAHAPGHATITATTGEVSASIDVSAARPEPGSRYWEWGWGFWGSQLSVDGLALFDWSTVHFGNSPHNQTTLNRLNEVLELNPDHKFVLELWPIMNLGGTLQNNPTQANLFHYLYEPGVREAVLRNARTQIEWVLNGLDRPESVVAMTFLEELPAHFTSGAATLRWRRGQSMPSDIAEFRSEIEAELGEPFDMGLEAHRLWWGDRYAEALSEIHAAMRDAGEGRPVFLWHATRYKTLDMLSPGESMIRDDVIPISLADLVEEGVVDGIFGYPNTQDTWQQKTVGPAEALGIPFFSQLSTPAVMRVRSWEETVELAREQHPLNMGTMIFAPPGRGSSAWNRVPYENGSRTWTVEEHAVELVRLLMGG